jgi:DNA-binding transcriptional ArsR family regulator
MEYTAEYAPGISQLAGPGRAAMIWALMDGRARPAGELALIATLSASSASGHLARLEAGGLVAVEAHGRNRYYRLATAEIGLAVEALAAASLAGRPPRLRNLPASRGAPVALRQARTCYDHLAGEVAVDLFARMARARWIAIEGKTVDLRAMGASALAAFGVDIDAARRTRRQFACTCPDWSERKPHLGGALGAALLDTLLARHWVERIAETRALRVTPAGHRIFAAFAA